MNDNVRDLLYETIFDLNQSLSVGDKSYILNHLEISIILDLLRILKTTQKYTTEARQNRIIELQERLIKTKKYLDKKNKK